LKIEYKKVKFELFGKSVSTVFLVPSSGGMKILEKLENKKIESQN
jgi:hypothetical protein